jgi:hypothetical protein
MTLAREAGATLASTVVGAAGALGLEKLLSGMKKGGTAADKDTAKYSHKQTAVMLGVGGAALGVLLHVKGIAPRIGKALAAGSVALAGARWVDHKDETYTAARAMPGSRGMIATLFLLLFLFSQRVGGQTSVSRSASSALLPRLMGRGLAAAPAILNVESPSPGVLRSARRTYSGIRLILRV